MNNRCLKIAYLLLSVILTISIFSEDVLSLSSQTGHRNGECVILLHGLGKTGVSMKRIEYELKKEGYEVWNEGYPSREKDVSSLADEYIAKAIDHCRGLQATKIHFVTHSLGGILTRKYLSEHEMSDLGRVVMLAPPNRGSEIADALKDLSVYKWATGPAGQELATDAGSTVNTIKPIDAAVGVIAGSKSYDPWFSPVIPGEDDGKVSLKNTELDEMTDYLIVNESHSFIVYDSGVIQQIINFLENGRFKDNKEEIKK